MEEIRLDNSPNNNHIDSTKLISGEININIKIEDENYSPSKAEENQVNQNYNNNHLNHENLPNGDDSNNHNYKKNNNTLFLSEKKNIKFSYLCDLFEKCIKIKKSTTKSNLIINFFKKYFETQDNFYPIFRLLFPKLDKIRNTYGLQERTLAKYYSDILALPSRESTMLKNWKTPNSNSDGIPSGDFCGLLTHILKSRCTDKSKMTINEVNIFLNELCFQPEIQAKINLLTNLIKKSSVLEQKWIISIILKDLKIGIGHETLFKLFHTKSIDVYNSTSNLIEVCNFIQDPKNPKFLNNFYRINQPIKPMLASRMTINDIIDNFMNVPVICETKYDGERIQCHYRDGEIKFYTRNGVDYTDLYGPKLSNFLKNNILAKHAILDGEILVWDKINSNFCKFGENKTIALAVDNNDKDLIYMIFDVIYLVTPSGAEHSLQEVILSDRKEILKKIITVTPQKIEIVQGKKCSNVEEIFLYFNKSIENNEEGIIVKKLDSTYRLDERTKDWVKMKCDYIDNLIDTLDLVIVGGYYGEGKRARGIGNDFTDNITSFLMGIVKNYDKENPKNSQVIPFVKVGTGYSKQQLDIIRSRLKNVWKNYDSRIPPKIFGNWQPGIKEKPDVFVEDPSESIILEVKAAEIISTETFPSRLTLRFPRVVEVRLDKSPCDGMNVSEIYEFYKNYQHNFLTKNKRKLETEDLVDVDGNEGKELKLSKRNKFSKVFDDFKDTETKNIFKKCEFLILNLDENIAKNISEKKNIETLIVENGGCKVQNFLPTTTNIVANKIDLRALNILKTTDIDIFKPKWVYDSVKYCKIMPKSPFYLSYISKSTQGLFAKTMDCFNDSFYIDVNKDMLKEIFDNIKIDSENCEENNKFLVKDSEYQKILKELNQDFSDCDWIKNLEEFSK